MTSPNATSAESDDRYEAAGPDPLTDSSEPSGAPQTKSKEIGNPGPPLTTRSYADATATPRVVMRSNPETRRQLLADYPALRSFFLPAPVPILDADSDPEIQPPSEPLSPKVGEPEISPPSEPLAPQLEADTGAALSYFSEAPLRGIKLLSAVFDELTKHLGKEFSSAELMRTAQQLIDLSKDEYVGVVHKDRAERASYYTWDLVRAFISHPWQIASVEANRIDHCDSDEFSPESFQNAKLLLEGWGERMWEF